MDLPECGIDTMANVLPYIWQRSNRIDKGKNRTFEPQSLPPDNHTQRDCADVPT